MGRRKKGQEDNIPIRSQLTEWFWGVGVILVSLVILYPMRDIFLGLNDEGVLPTGASWMIRGQIIYKDFFEFQVPFPFFLTAGAFAVFGESMEVVRALGLLIGVLCSVLSYFHARMLGISRLISLFPPLFLLWAGPPLYLTYHWLALAFFLSGLLLILRMGSQRFGPITVFFCGLFVGIEFLTVQTKGAALGIVFITALVAAQILRNRARIFSGIFGTLLIPCLFSLYFLYHGSFGQMLYDTIVWPIEGYADFNRYPGYYFAGRAQIVSFYHSGQWFDLLNLIVLGYLSPAAMFVCVGVLLWMIWRKAQIRGPLFVKAMSILAGCLIFTSVLYRSDVVHLVQISPLLTSALCLLFTGGIVPMNRLINIAGRIFLVFLLVLSAYGNLRNLTITKMRYVNAVHFPKGTLRVISAEEAKDLQEAVEYVSSRTSEGDPVFIYHYSPLLYMLLGRTNPTRYDIIIPGYCTPNQLTDALKDLQGIRPPVILKDNFSEFFQKEGLIYFPLADRSSFANDPIQAFVSKEYRMVQRGYISIYTLQ